MKLILNYFKKEEIYLVDIFNFCWLFQRVSVIWIRPHLTNREVLRKRLWQFHHPETSLLLECSSE